MMAGNNAPIDILLVEDDPDDADLAIDLLRESTLQARVHTARDGEEALAFLAREAPFTAAPHPDLMILDLNMPRKNGFETLRDLKANPAWATIPVIVFTTSDAERDILEAYRLDANCVITKPVDIDDFDAVRQEIEAFWHNIAHLGDKPGSAPDETAAAQ